jgi:hypothetical protein
VEDQEEVSSSEDRALSPIEQSWAKLPSRDAWIFQPLFIL